MNAGCEEMRVEDVQKQECKKDDKMKMKQKSCLRIKQWEVNMSLLCSYLRKRRKSALRRWTRLVLPLKKGNIEAKQERTRPESRLVLNLYF